MRILTREECSAWLVSHSIVEEPSLRAHQVACPSPFYDQVNLPRDARKQSRIAKKLVPIARPYGAAVLQFDDWVFYTPDEMAVIQAIRRAHGETRLLIDAPNHLFGPDEEDLLVGMSSLAMFYAWRAYLYFDHGTSFYFWEGEKLDLFAYNETQYVRALEVFADCDLPSNAPEGE